MSKFNDIIANTKWYKNLKAKWYSDEKIANMIVDYAKKHWEYDQLKAKYNEYKKQDNNTPNTTNTTPTTNATNTPNNNSNTVNNNTTVNTNNSASNTSNNTTSTNTPKPIENSVNQTNYNQNKPKPNTNINNNQKQLKPNINASTPNNTKYNNTTTPNNIDNYTPTYSLSWTFWRWTNAIQRDTRNQNIARHIFESWQKLDNTKLFNDIKAKVPYESDANIWNTVHNIQAKYNLLAKWDNELSKFAQTNNIPYKVDNNWQVIFQPNDIHQMITIVGKYWKWAQFDKNSIAYIKWSAAWNILKKYKDWDANTILWWIQNWDITPWSQAWNDLIKINWWITPAMQEWLAKYNEMLASKQSKESITDLIWWNNLPSYVNQFQKVINNLDNTFQKNIEAELNKMKIAFESYNKGSSELREKNKEISWIASDIDELQLAKRNIMDDIKKRHPWIPLALQLAEARRETKAIDEQIFAKQREYNIAMSDYKYLSTQEQAKYKFNIQQIQQQMNILNTMYTNKKQELIRYEDIVAQHYNLEEQARQKQEQLKQSLINNQIAQAQKFKYDLALIEAKKKINKANYQFLTPWNGLIAVANPNTWIITYKQISPSTVWLPSKYTVAWSWKLDFSKNEKLLEEAALKGDWTIKNNNPAWITYTVASPELQAMWKKAWVNFTMWSARKKTEWWNYVKFATVQDGMKAYNIALFDRWYENIEKRLEQWVWWVWTEKARQYATSILEEAWIDWSKNKQDLTEAERWKLIMAQMRHESNLFYNAYKNSINEGALEPQPKFDAFTTSVLMANKNSPSKIAKILKISIPQAQALYNSYYSPKRVATELWIPIDIFQTARSNIPTQLKNGIAEATSIKKWLSKMWKQLQESWIKKLDGNDLLLSYNWITPNSMTKDNYKLTKNLYTIYESVYWWNGDPAVFKNWVAAPLTKWNKVQAISFLEQSIIEGYNKVNDSAKVMTIPGLHTNISLLNNIYNMTKNLPDTVFGKFWWNFAKLQQNLWISIKNLQTVQQFLQNVQAGRATPVVWTASTKWEEDKYKNDLSSSITDLWKKDFLTRIANIEKKLIKDHNSFRESKWLPLLWWWTNYNEALKQILDPKLKVKLYEDNTSNNVYDNTSNNDGIILNRVSK